ncbi:MAG: peptidase [Parcubacteria group bacterium]|nr:peptidase [Parcubacteria group bacterium]
MTSILGKGFVLLTSTGFSNTKVADTLISNLTNIPQKRAAVVTTAAEDKAENRYSILAKEQLEGMGFGQVDFLDLEIDGSEGVPSYDLIYVCGGNTFKLLFFARSTDFKEKILEVLSRGGCYVGVSAGSLIAGPSIQIANEVAPDKNDVSLKDFTGLSIVSSIVFPHYTVEHELEIISFESRNSVKITRLTNDQALLIMQDSQILI